jgi:hypothetical protein
MAMAKARIKSLFYKNERSLSFEKVMEILSKSFSTLDKDPDERFSECEKVEKLLQCIQTPDMEVVAQKSVIASQYQMSFQALVMISQLRFHICMAEPSWRIVSTQKSIMCLLCMVAEVKTAAVVEDMVALVVVVGLVAVVEVALVDEVEVAMTGQNLLMALMYRT